MDTLSQKTDQRLQEISGQVEKRLAELSSNVVSLQEILDDKRSRGAFGEVQLNSLISNVMPEGNYSLQYTLPKVYSNT